ncbi:MAG TPA: hypothetical protein VLL52_21670 [Anaerolineae bacterium]|nr:hypothetical protein [Anaerolineae bacterium]
MRYFKVVLLVLMMAIGVVGCGILGGDDDSGDEVPTTVSDSPSLRMLPVLPNHKTVPGEDLTGYITALGGGTALLTGQPQLAAAIAAVDQVMGCYQEIGAVSARAYSNEEMPLSSGVVAIADKGMMSNPVNLFNCLGPSGGSDFTMQGCTASYTLPKDDNEFFILYAGTTLEICQDFCAQLEGCTAHIKP